MNHKKISKSGKYQSLKGKFYPLNKEKYTGEGTPEFKSKLEQKLMYLCDKSPYVISWSYERIVIPYMDKTRTTKTGQPTKHNYYMDFKITMKSTSGPKTFLIEVKSEKETQKPVNSPRKKPENYKKELETYVRNMCKWEAATQSARARGWEFKIFTERHLN